MVVDKPQESADAVVIVHVSKLQCPLEQITHFLCLLVDVGIGVGVEFCVEESETVGGMTIGLLWLWEKMSTSVKERPRYLLECKYRE